MGTLESNQLLVDKIDPEVYQQILAQANSFLKTPLLWYISVKCILTFISFVFSVSLIISLIFTSFIWAGVSGAVVLITFVCIRESGNQYYKVMQKTKEKLGNALEELQRIHLSSTNVKIFVGEYCNWLDFTTAEPEIVQEKPIQTFHIFTPGTSIPKGTTTTPLL